MSQERTKSGERGQQKDGPAVDHLRRRVVQTGGNLTHGESPRPRQPKGKLDCEAAFQRVEDQGCNCQPFRTCAGNIGCADVSAAGMADILSAEDAHQQIAEGYRTQQVGNHDDSECKFRQSYAMAANYSSG